MLRSMTGYAALSGDVGTAKWDWELRSVNAKGLDFRVRIPEGFEGLEPLLRAAAKTCLHRGSVTASLRFTRRSQTATSQLQVASLGASLDAISRIEAEAARRNIMLRPTSAAEVAGLPGVLDASEPGLTPEMGEIKRQIPTLFALLVEMRSKEGAALSQILEGQINTSAALVARAERSAEARQARSKDLMKERVAALLDASDGADPARLQQELAILSVKTDVTEEIDRLGAHVNAARALLGEGGPIGRKFDFLLQEFNREANTLCSKSGSTELTTIGMDLKVVVDQMREQIQNLE